MPTWNLGLQDVYQLVLASDSRFNKTDYLNDHIYELRLKGGEPPALSLYTTYGLRARSMRLFPRFIQGEKILLNPVEFLRPPKVVQLYPNFIEILYSPFGGTDVQAEYWALSSQMVGGRFRFTNPSVLPEVFDFEWNGLLSPLGQGAAMSVVEMGLHTVLHGESDNLHILCFMTGGPQAGSGPYAGLGLRIDLEPGETRQIAWTLTAQPDVKTAYDQAKAASATAWDAELARIELTNQSDSLQITTGDPEWDAVFLLAQRTANQLVFPASQYLPRPSFVLARQPDSGFSLRGDGSDYNHLWNGQTALDTWTLSGILLPGRVETVAGLIENFIATARKDGFLDWKPGLAGQRSGWLAQPFLSNLAWQVYSLSEDLAWLNKVYPPLLAFFRCWLNQEHDHDQDGLPEYSHPFQSALDENPLFNFWQDTGQGVEISKIESPALAAMLYREARALQRMAGILNRKEESEWLNHQGVRLQQAVEETWDESNATYQYRDAVTHSSQKGENLVSIAENGKYPLNHKFTIPQRIVLKITADREVTRRTHIKLSGAHGRRRTSEDIPTSAIHWLHETGWYTSQNHYSVIKEITIKGMSQGEITHVATVDFSLEDITLLLPLWAKIPAEERARKLVEQTILARYRRPFGLAICPQGRPELRSETCFLVRIPWNQMIIEGLLHYQYRKEAAELFEGIMRALIQAYRSEHASREFYHGMSGRGGGERNIRTGLASPGLFLKILGLKFINEKKIIIDGFNPFSWPVTVQYRGNKIEFFNDNTRITFRGKQPVTVSGEGPHQISLVE